jgi:restriction system protein
VLVEEPSQPSFLTASIIEASEPAKEGILLRSTSEILAEIVQHLKADWDVASQIHWRKWEEIIAAAFHKDGYDEVVLTHGSGDKGRDVIATRYGVGSIKILGSVKAYSPGKLVRYDDVRALAGAISMEPDVSKGMLITTSSFPQKIHQEEFMSRLIPTRLELLDGPALLQWLIDLHSK